MLRLGMKTQYTDINGAAIKVGDRIQHVRDNVIYTVNKYKQAEGPHGVKLPLRGLYPSKNFRIIPDEEAAAIADGVTGDEAREIQKEQQPDPLALKPADPEVVRNLLTGQAPETPAEPEPTDEAPVPDEDTPDYSALGDFQDEDLADELRARGFRGRLTKTKILNI